MLNKDYKKPLEHNKYKELNTINNLSSNDWIWDGEEWIIKKKETSNNEVSVV